MAGPRIAMVTLGTPGDVIPFVALGTELRERGCAVTILSNEDHGPFVRDHGFGFVPVCDAERPDSGIDRDGFFEHQLVPSYYSIERELGRFATREGPAFAINRLGNLGAIFACERHALPSFSVLLQPDSIWEEGNPITTAMLPSLNEFRLAIGLTAIEVDHVEESAVALVSLFPYWFGYPRTLSPKAGRCFGFPFFDGAEARSLPDEVVAFIARFGPPVVFTTGTNIHDIDTFRHAAEAIRMETGRPVIFLSRHGLHSATTDEGFRQFRHIDHALLLPHAAVVIHNGGIGVTAQAMRAGVPQVALPLVWDQPDNAARIEALGVGRVVQPEALTPSTLVKACRDAMDMDRRSLLVVADAVRRTRAILDAVEFIQATACETLNIRFAERSWRHPSSHRRSG